MAICNHWVEKDVCYFLENGGIYTARLCPECAYTNDAVKAKDLNEAREKLLPLMVFKIYEKLFKTEKS